MLPLYEHSSLKATIFLLGSSLSCLALKSKHLENFCITNKRLYIWNTTETKAFKSLFKRKEASWIFCTRISFGLNLNVTLKLLSCFKNLIMTKEPIPIYIENIHSIEVIWYYRKNVIYRQSLKKGCVWVIKSKEKLGRFSVFST